MHSCIYLMYVCTDLYITLKGWAVSAAALFSTAAHVVFAVFCTSGAHRHCRWLPAFLGREICGPRPGKRWPVLGGATSLVKLPPK